MIGHIAQAYRAGRNDALSGRRRARVPWQESRYLHRFYILGWNDERARMDESGRLPQLKLELVCSNGPEAENRAPQMPQERRSGERMSLNTPETD